jgi:hypothetical protein
MNRQIKVVMLVLWEGKMQAWRCPRASPWRPGASLWRPMASLWRPVASLWSTVFDFGRFEIRRETVFPPPFSPPTDENHPES